MADWRRDAACRDEDTELFFPPGEFARQIQPAKALCGACPVTDACLTYALAAPERYGIWGGMTEDERAQERRRAARRGWDGPVKTCARCQVPQPAGQFYRRDGRKDGRDSYCRACHVELTRKRRTRKEATAT